MSGLDWKKISLFVVISFVVLFSLQIFLSRRSFPEVNTQAVALQNDQALKVLHSELSKMEARFEQKLAFHMEQLSSSFNKVPPPPKPQPVPIKPDLERIKLKNFLKWLKKYEEFHNKVTSGKILKSDVKFVRCVGTNGFGNAFQSIISCFLYALVSNRVFLLSAETPFPMANYFDKAPIDYYAFHLVENLKEHEINPEDLVCEHFSAHKKKLVFMLGAWGYDYFGQTIVTNPLYNLTETLPLNFYSLISDFLFPLKPSLQAKVDDFKKKNFGQHTIAIQIRATIPKTHSSGDWYKGKKDHEGHPIPPLSLFIQAAEMISHSNPKYNFDEINWYIMTQDTGIVKALKKRFGKKIAFYEGKIITTFDEDEEGQETSFLTWWIAGECDDFITTESSSYGTTAAARAGVAPVVCNHGRWCARRLTPQPCQQVPYYGKEESGYQILPPDCLKDKSRTWNSVESSCAFFEAIIRDDPRYERGDSW